MRYHNLIVGGLKRQPLRTAFTVSSLAIAFLLFGVLQPVHNIFTHRDSLAGADRLLVLPRHSITDFLPERYAKQIGALSQVREVAHRTWFGGKFRDAGNNFARWAVPAAAFLNIHADVILSAEQRQAFVDTPNAAIIGIATADKYGIHIGDTVPLIPDIWNNKDAAQWEFLIVGIYTRADSTPATEMYLNYDYFDASRAWGRGQVSHFIVALNDDRGGAGLADNIAQQIDAQFANSEAETRTASEQEYALSFAAQIGNVGLMVTGILAAVFFTIVTLTANTMSQSIRERTAELAVLRTLGFQAWRTFNLLLAETLAITSLGAATGLALAGGLIGLLRSLAPQIGAARIDIATVAWSICITVAIAIAAGAPPAWRASRLNVIDALRSI